MFITGSGHLRAIAVCLTLAAAALSPNASAAPSAIESVPHAEAAESEFLLRRLPPVLEAVRRAAVNDAVTHAALSKIRFSAPSRSYETLNPNAYAVSVEGRDLILFESRFARQINAMSVPGALIAITEKGNEAHVAGMAVCGAITRLHAEATSARAPFVVKLDLDDMFRLDAVQRSYFEKVQGIISDEALIWFVLHEAAHHVLGHTTTPPTSLAHRRQREADADIWASRKMVELGVGLFGAAHYLRGRALIDLCLSSLRKPTPESESSHPTWARRAANIERQFDIHKTGRGSPRMFHMPGIPNIAFVLPDRGDTGWTVIVENRVPLRGASEWRDRSVTVFVRSIRGGRFEYRIHDATSALTHIDQTEFDAKNNVIRRMPNAVCLQMTPVSLDWMDMGDGRSFAHWRSRNHRQDTLSFIRRAGAPDSAAPAVMASIDEFSTAESVLVLRFMKGEITGPEFGLQYDPINNRHRSNLVNALGKHYERYEAVIKSDPRYAWGSSIGRNQGAFEDELLRRNLGR